MLNKEVRSKNCNFSRDGKDIFSIILTSLTKHYYTKITKIEKIKTKEKFARNVVPKLWL